MQFHEEKGLDKRRKIGYTCKADDFYRQEAAGNVQGFAICHAAGLLRLISDTASVSADGTVLLCRPVPQRDRGDRRHHPSGGAGRHQAWRTDFAGNGRQAAVCGEVQRSAGKLQCDRLDVTVDPDTDGRPAAGADRLPRGNGSGTSRAGAALKKLAGEEITWHLRDFPEN